MTAASTPPPRLWVDIDDLVDYLEHHDRPSGIQRVVHELSQALVRCAAGRVGFIRRGTDARDLRTLDWDHVDGLFRDAMGRPERPQVAPDAAPEAPVQAVPEDAGDGAAPDLQDVPAAARPGPVPGAGDAVSGLQPAATGPARMVRLQVAVFGGMARAALAIGRHGVGSMQVAVAGRRARRREHARLAREPASLATFEEAPGPQPRASLRSLLPPGTPLREVARPGDVFITLGAPWHHADYGGIVRHLRDDLRLRFALLMYDLVPVRHPEWCDRGMSKTYEAWHDTILPLVDELFAISNATARDIAAYLDEYRIEPPPIRAIGLGTGFSGTAMTPMSSRPIVEGRYVLFVSTIEARKNHTLLFRVWRRLLAELPADEVPTLVFAGREGWLVADLMRQLDNTDWLDGRIRFVRNPSDADLHRLYDDCLFTVFPSLFEGWGLPVTESLGMGRPCIASNTTSIPEAGGTLARYFNPYDLHDAYRVIRDAILDRDGLARWTETVRAEFRPVPWDHSAGAILQTLGIG